MADIPRERVIAPGLPWRTIGVGLVIIALLVGTFVVIGSRRPALPPPFGVAKAGLVAFSQDGDIFVADHLSGKATAIVTGGDDDSRPQWSLDGTRIAFTRRVPTAGAYQLYVVQPDGSGLTLVTPEPLQWIETYSFSPDGQAILIGGALRVVVDGIKTTDRSIFIAAADGSGLRTVDVGMIVMRPTYRPPTGQEITFVGAAHEGAYPGIYAVNADGSGLRTIVEPSKKTYVDGALWSPDGTRFAYHEWHNTPNLPARAHLVSADGPGDPVLESDGAWNVVLAWSNDSSRLAILRGYGGGMERARIVAVPVDGSGPSVELQDTGDPAALCCLAWAWAPDDSTILGALMDARGDLRAHVLWDPMTGEMTPAPWVANAPPSWQRLAP
jgi:dipeptidyl aminopeptidase/acylaminoacyl peptidase